MLAERKKWDEIEEAAYSRSMISKVKKWFLQLPLEEALTFSEGDARIMSLRKDYVENFVPWDKLETEGFDGCVTQEPTTGRHLLVRGLNIELIFLEKSESRFAPTEFIRL
jgi:hypothetical protein